VGVDFAGIALVTGAAGFIGRHVVENLVHRGLPVRATDRAEADLSVLQGLGIEFVPADLTRPETLSPLFSGGVDRVFHLGAICNLSTPYEKLYPTNVVGVEHITKLALQAEVRCYVHVSSTSVYGPYRGKPFTEDDPRDPQDAYGRSKKDGEEVVWKRTAEGLPSIVARPCTVYGPGCNDGAGKVFSRPTILSAIPGSGTQRLSNVRVEDVASALLHLSQARDAVGKAFNIAEDSHPTLQSALARVAESFGQKPPKTRLPLGLIKAFARVQGWAARFSGHIPDLEYDAVRFLVDDYVVDNTRLKQTGYALIHPCFETSMQQIGEWHRSHRA
jgi:UDP-glucose 4-epimerase